MKEIRLCLLYEKGSIEQCLMDLLKISKQQIKKSKLNKKFLNSEVKKTQVVTLPIDLVNHLKINPVYDGQDIKVLMEDENFLVLKKNHKVHMHPKNYSQSDNLLSFMQKDFSKLLSVNKNHYDRGLIYRLDYETSGIIYYAKSDEIYNKVRSEFHKIMQQKSYFAIVKGKCELCGLHSHYLKSTGPKGQKMQVTNELDFNTQLANLEIEIIAYNAKEDITLLKVYLKTGLRHQIRCQLSALGYPIVGDELYGGEKAQRLFLHAYQYKFNFNETFYDLKCDVDELFKCFFNFNSNP